MEYDALSNNECTFLFYEELFGMKNVVVPKIMTKVNFDLFYERLVDENLGNMLTIQRRWRRCGKSKPEIDTIVEFIVTLLFQDTNPDLISANMIIFLYTEYILCESGFSVSCLARLYSEFSSVAYDYYDDVTECEPDFPGSVYYPFDRWMYYQLLGYFHKYIECYLNSNYRKIDIIWEEWDDLENTYVSYAEWLPREIVEDVAGIISSGKIANRHSLWTINLPIPESYTEYSDSQPHVYTRMTTVPNETRPGWVTLRRPYNTRNEKK